MTPDVTGYWLSCKGMYVAPYNVHTLTLSNQKNRRVESQHSRLVPRDVRSIVCIIDEGLLMVSSDT